MRDLTTVVVSVPVFFNISTDNNVDVGSFIGDDGRRCGLAGESDQIILYLEAWKAIATKPGWELQLLKKERP